jgi:hypothetical protein
MAKKKATTKKQNPNPVKQVKKYKAKTSRTIFFGKIGTSLKITEGEEISAEDLKLFTNSRYSGMVEKYLTEIKN